MKTGFYMVFVEGQSSPTYKHENIETATAEAIRLSDKTGSKTYVLATVSLVEPRVKDIIPYGFKNLPF